MAQRVNSFQPNGLLGLLDDAKAIAREAGAILMRHYDAHRANADYLEIISKADSSPVTAADHASHKHIVGALTALTPNIPIISEENKEHPDVSQGLFWTVDPLDGTKGFINKNDHFYVKIALIEDAQPILGVIYEPVHDRFHFSAANYFSYMQYGTDRPQMITTKCAPQKGQLSTLFNGLHYDKAAYFAARQALSGKGIDTQDLAHANGQCAKAFYMAVASGEADIYLDCGRETSLRGGNGYSWDYAPDALIVPNAGGVMLEITTGQPPRFDKPTRRMNAMVALGDRNLGKRLLPAMKNDCL